MSDFEEFTELTEEEALAYCKGSEGQRVHKVMAGMIHGHVLDICCGNGIDAFFHPSALYRGVDISEPLIKAARRLHPDHIFKVCDARTLPWPDKYFDFAIIKSALEHVPSKEIAVTILREACRVAKTVLVAWHTPPKHLPASQIIRTVGHYGKAIYQNHYSRSAFQEFNVEEEMAVDNFELWTIR